MDILGFSLAVLMIELTPGPNMAWLGGLAATEGRRCGLAAVGGVALGLLANSILAAVGLAALLQAVPQLWDGLRFAGAGMMLWLAIEAWRGSGDPARAVKQGRSPRRAFATGALINLLNPKAYLFFVLLAPQFLSGQTLSIANATAVHLAIVLAGSGAHDWLSDPARTRIARRLFALVMLAVAASFLLADLRRH